MAKPKEFVGINFPMNMRQVSFGSRDNAQRSDAAETDENESESDPGCAADKPDSRDPSPPAASKATPKGRKNRHDHEENIVAKLSPSQKEAIVKEYLRQQNVNTDQNRGRSSQSRSGDRLTEDRVLGSSKHGKAVANRKRQDRALNDAFMETYDKDKELPFHEFYPPREYPSHLVYRVSRPADTVRPSTAPHPGNIMVPTATTAQGTALNYGGSVALEAQFAYQFRDQAAASGDRQAEYAECRPNDGFGQNEQRVTIEDVSDSASEEGIGPATTSRAGTLPRSPNRGFDPSIPASTSPLPSNGIGAQTSSTLYPTLLRLSGSEPQHEESARNLDLPGRSPSDAFASSAVGSKRYKNSAPALITSPQRPSQDILETYSTGSAHGNRANRPRVNQTQPDMDRSPIEMVEDHILPGGQARHDENLTARRASHFKAEITDDEAELRRILGK